MSSSGHHEAIPCVQVKFEVHRGNQIDYFDVECTTLYTIEGLKVDNAKNFGILYQNQVWTYNGDRLENSALLENCFDTTDNMAKTIVVRNSDESVSS